MQTAWNEPTRRTYEPLPLGDVRPRGWLRRQLEIQAGGLTGHLDEFWPDLADNRWRGGTNDGWERGPYYADGLVPLAHLLDDDDLRAKASQWADAFVDGLHEDGWIGPPEAAGEYEPYDPWPRFVVLKVLRQQYEATGDTDALDAMVAFCRYLAGALQNRSLFSWGRYRWADLVVSVHWLYERTGEEWLLPLAAVAADQGYDWREQFTDFHHDLREVQPPDRREMETHVVNNAMGVKSPGVRYAQSGSTADRDAALAAIENLDRCHGQVTGVFTGDEHFAGRNPSRGTELCAVVEYLYSLEYLASALGVAPIGDRLERVAFNALPATFTPDMWTHQYDQQANQVICNVAQREWSNGPDANIFGVEPNYGCCTANMHQGWPKLAARLWMRTGDEGLASVAYAPSEVSTELDGQPVVVRCETDYPFEDTVDLTVGTTGDAAFPLELRVPGWAVDPTLVLPDGSTRSLEPGTYERVDRTWRDGDELELSLPATVEAVRGYQGSVALRRGPLVFSLPVEAQRQQIGGERPHADWEFHPVEAWNYGLSVDPDAPETTVELARHGVAETPFDPDEPPLTLSVSGARVPDWTLTDNNWPGPIPHSPTPAEVREELTLVPYGCTTLRVTEFPLVE
jgi:hypothetical protein